MILTRKIEKLGKDSSDNTVCLFTIIVDDETDLPAANYFENDASLIICQGSKAWVIGSATEYMMQSDGTWCIQNGSTAAYTKAEVDYLLSEKQNTLTFDNTPTSGSTNPVTSGGIYTAISGFVTIDDIFGQGTAIISTTENPGDLNDYKTPGKYHGYNAVTNSLLNLPIPNTNTHIGLIVAKITDSNILQIAKFGGLSYDKYWYWRRYAVATDTWQPWYKLEGVQV